MAVVVWCHRDLGKMKAVASLELSHNNVQLEAATINFFAA